MKEPDPRGFNARGLRRSCNVVSAEVRPGRVCVHRSRPYLRQVTQNSIRQPQYIDRFPKAIQYSVVDVSVVKENVMAGLRGGRTQTARKTTLSRARLQAPPAFAPS